MPKLDESQRRQVGTLLHDCGLEIPVFQSKRTHLYIRCPQCGTNQSNDAATQTHWYAAMTPGAAPFPKPRNVREPEPIGETAPKTEPEKTGITVLPDGADSSPPDTRQSRAAPESDGILTEPDLTEKNPIGSPQAKPGAGGLALIALASVIGGTALILSAR